MRTLLIVAFAMMLSSCGKDEAVSPDLGGSADMRSSDAAVVDAGTPDLAAPAPDMSETNGETPRPDLDVVLMDTAVDFNLGESQRFVVQVPEDTVSLTVSVTGPAGYSYAISRWVNGDGEVLVPNTWLEDDLSAPIVCTVRTCPLQIASAPSTFAAQLPNNGKVKVAPGAHSISAYAFSRIDDATTEPADGISGTMRVVAKRLPAPPETGVLDMNFYFTGARGWTAASAPTDADFQGVLGELRTTYAQADIELGVVTYTDIPAEYAVIEDLVSTDADLEELFVLTANQPRHAVNVFMIEQIFYRDAGNDFALILGVSGGVPGPSIAGTPRSGVVISSEGDPRSPLPTAQVLAHEVGHYLGLFHTTEAGSPLHDPIDDTPQFDETQLMHAIGDGTLLSPTQGDVMRRNVWVNHSD